MESPGYQRRLMDDLLDELLPELPAIALEGAKGVGKTATASQRATRRVRLDVDEERSAFAASPFGLTPQGTLLLDEWQRYPESWGRGQRAVDDGAPPGSFILAGSTAPRGAAIHSGAGRIVPLRLRPLSLVERGIEQATVSLSALLQQDQAEISGETSIGLPTYVDEIFASGFPGIRTMNPFDRLVTSPRHFLADPALSAHLLGLNQPAVLAGADQEGAPLNQGSMLGALFEALVVQSVRTYAVSTDAQAGHLRLRDGRHEADIIVHRGSRFVGIEVKLARDVDDKDVRHLL